MDRREFLAKAGLAATWAGVSIRISGCGDEGGSDNMMGNGGGDVVGVVTGSGHSHDIDPLTEQQLAQGQGVTLQLSGSGHLHEVTLTDSEVMTIADGTRVVKQTDPDNTGHPHDVTFN